MKYTLITGACGGLGGAFVQVLIERGEPLYLTGRSEERLKNLASALKEQFPAAEIKYFPCDLQSSESRMAFFAQTDSEGIRFSRLVYVAGVDTQKAVERYTEEKLLMQARVNFEGAVSFMRAVLDRADLNGNTEILSIGSMSGVTPMPYFALYSATKKALEQFSQALRTELKGRARVTCVQPGGIPTREDIKENIKEHGFWGKISAKSPRSVAEISLKAVRRNKRKKVVGFWNKVINFFSALAPAPLRLRFIAKRWKETEKDAF